MTAFAYLAGPPCLICPNTSGRVRLTRIRQSAPVVSTDNMGDKMTRRIVAAALCALVGGAGLAGAQEHAHPGGEQLGTVRFATSCHPSTRATFDRAVALLHSFEFGMAIRAFNEVAAADSTCAMAQWGLALSRWTNPMVASLRPHAVLQNGRQASVAAVRLMTRASERERGYIRAVARLYEDFENRDQPTRVAAYEAAMRELVVRQPADTEAKIFHAIALAATAPPTDKSFAKQLEAGRMLEELWARQPNHPGIAHYIIHAYDYPPLAGRARQAAERYSRIAPSAAHALHMPSHTFTRVGMWDASVLANRRSMDVAIRDGSFAEALHAADYTVYALLQEGKEAEARAVIDRLPELEARFDPDAITGAAPGSAGVFALAAIPARWALERNAWAEAAALAPRTTTVPYADAMTHFVRALGASRVGELAKARASVDSLAALQRRLVAEKEVYWAEQVAIQQLGAQAWLDLAEQRETEALARMREAVAREDATEKNAVTPGPLAPARELLGDMLMQLKRPAEAKEAYRATLMKEPNRRRAVRGLGGSSGDQSDARRVTYRSPGGTTLRVLLDESNVGPKPLMARWTREP